MSEATKHAISEKANIRARIGTNTIQYKEQKTVVKHLCKIDKQNMIDRDHQELNSLPPDVKYYTVMKRMKLSREKQIKSWGIKSKTGTTLTSSEKILKRWAEFYKDLYDSKTSGKTNYQETDPVLPVTLDELQHAIKLLKPNKAPGPDSIVAEMFKHGGNSLHKYLLELINTMLSTRATPTQMQLTEIITLFKKGDRLSCNNYRPISLLSHLYKLVMQIIYNRLKTTLISSLPKEQAAYQPGRNTIEMIQTLQQVIQKSNEFQRNIGICFIDYTKAFDSVDQKKLWNALHTSTNIDPAYINIISMIYDNTNAQIRTDIGTTEQIPLLKGVKQGDTLSALLFCIVLKVIMEKTIKPSDRCISIGGIKHSNGAYADDLGIIGASISELNSILNRLKENSAEFGLNINLSKTKVMLIGKHNSNDTVTIGGEAIKVVDKFEYLGRVLSKSGSDMPALEDRIGKAWGAFEKKKDIITSKHISMKTKRHTYETYILPVVTYATETMTWTKQMMKKIKVFNNHIMRWMCGARLRDKQSIESLHLKTRVKDIIPTIKLKKLQWFGHLKRSSQQVKITFEGLVEGKRKQGRPSRRWRDDIVEWCGGYHSMTELNQMTKNRKAWRGHCYAVCSSGERV